MKITWLHILLLVGVVVITLLISKCNEKPEEPTITKSTYDSIMQIIEVQDRMLDSLAGEIKKTDTVIIHTKEFIYVKGKNTLSLNANNSIRVFNEWTRYMHDSVTRLGYFCSVSDSLN